jgi:hypothetical protein
VLDPDMCEFEFMLRSLESGDGPASRMSEYCWPDMQFLTAWYSGRWHNVDLCFAGLSGYPDVAVLFGTHFAGPKPWQVGHRTVSRRFCRFPDFQLWYREFLELMEQHRALSSWKRLSTLERFAAEKWKIRASNVLEPARDRQYL